MFWTGNSALAILSSKLLEKCILRFAVQISTRKCAFREVELAIYNLTRALVSTLQVDTWLLTRRKDILGILESSAIQQCRMLPRLDSSSNRRIHSLCLQVRGAPILKARWKVMSVECVRRRPSTGGSHVNHGQNKEVEQSESSVHKDRVQKQNYSTSSRQINLGSP